MIICNLSEEIICIVILIISLVSPSPTNVSAASSLTISKDGRTVGRLKGPAGAADDDHFPRHMVR